MSAAVANENLKPNAPPVFIACVGCGHTLEAGCDCNKHFIILKPIDRARAAIARNPRRTNVAIAAELNIDEGTVRNARKSEKSEKNPKRPSDGEVFHAQLQGIMDDVRAGAPQEWTDFLLLWNSCSATTRARIRRYVAGDIHA